LKLIFTQPFQNFTLFDKIFGSDAVLVILGLRAFQNFWVSVHLLTIALFFPKPVPESDFHGTRQKSSMPKDRLPV